MDDAAEKDKKRSRSGESELDTPESDLTRADSFGLAEPDPDSPDPKRLRVDSDLESPDVKRIQDDLLNILDDTDGVADRDPAIQDLDSVIRSFEEEILMPDQPPAVVDVGDAQTELGYLLEASDDELGLPPGFGSSEDDQKSEAAEAPATSAGGFEFNDDSFGFDGGLPNYDSFELGMCGGPDGGNRENDSQFVALGGLFDFTDDGGVDASELLWRPESLPAM